MAWKPIKTTFKDAVWSGLRKYKEQQNSDGTVSFQDMTQYTYKDDSLFGAKEVNQIAEAINTIMDMTENGTDLYTAFQSYFDTQKAQFTAHTNEAMTGYEQAYEQRISSFENVQTNEFTIWFNALKSQLNGDVAGNLQNQITEADTRIAQIDTKLKKALFIK